MSSKSKELFADISWHTPKVGRVEENTHRLDASFFSGHVDIARSSLTSSRLQSLPLREIANVFALSDFSLKRMPAQESCGIPFFTFSDVLEFDPSPTMFLSRKHETSLQNYIVEEGWILLSRAGTVGKTFIVGPELAGKTVSNHAIRIVPKDNATRALVYLVLSGVFGQQIISSIMYGSVVDVVKPSLIEQIEVPIPAPEVLESLSNFVEKSISLRSAAIQLSHEIDLRIQTANCLPTLKVKEECLDSDKLHAETFEVQSKSVMFVNKVNSEYRLDAHYYNPTAEFVIHNLKKQGSNLKLLKDVAQHIVMGPRFKRNYVESDRGVPFLSGKNIIQIRPTDLKYLSNLQMADMQELIVKRGWTLITCSGTVGRTCFVWNNYEGYAASQHILRVVPDETIVDPGYLYAFLSSVYGYEQIIRYRHGSVIDEITDKQLEHILVPYPSPKDQKIIGDMVREVYRKRAEAIRLEDQAQTILIKELTNIGGAKGGVTCLL